MCKICTADMKRERAKTPETKERLAKTKRKAHSSRLALRLEVLGAYGGKCVCCGESNAAFLTLDRIDNDGAAHRRKVKAIYSWAKRNNYPSALQLLCWNCNCAKRVDGSCPHN